MISKLSLLFIFVLLVNSCLNKENLKTKELQIKASLTNNEALFGHATDFTYSPINSTFYINDQPASIVHKFNFSGEYLKRIGNEGRGPDQLNYPLSLAKFDGGIIINDQGNQRLQILNLSDNFVNSFLMPNQFSDFIVFDSLIYSFVYRPGVRVNDHDLKNFIDVYDLEGNHLKNFGKHLNLVEGLPIIMSESFLQNLDNDLYALSKYFPIVNVFEGKAREQKEIRLKNSEYIDRVAINYKQSTYINLRNIPSKYLFRGFFIDHSGLYVGLFDDNLIIDQYTFTGEFVKRYTYKHGSENYYLIDFLIINNNFYVLEKIDSNTNINIYTR